MVDISVVAVLCERCAATVVMSPEQAAARRRRKIATVSVFLLMALIGFGLIAAGLLYLYMHGHHGLPAKPKVDIHNWTKPPKGRWT